MTEIERMKEIRASLTAAMRELDELDAAPLGELDRRLNQIARHVHHALGEAEDALMIDAAWQKHKSAGTNNDGQPPNLAERHT